MQRWCEAVAIECRASVQCVEFNLQML